ncbi:beta-L-arabinofuranosidase domain-containing protein [Paenibacillus sp. PL91]|uniref:beta-L-arabinofuranosidase domain-containing protein n=1 Tax=Paenibacillus sp. PL91 TaxID=2729538 RepID=UPI00145CE2DC|nr:beta-L-arabinofuranosidase domain-containing protein [Paenibacillus sp. PL91]MBC9198769.1 glycoside hydrolase family 127 protein [Paenibacillus sp. PL91]
MRIKKWISLFLIAAMLGGIIQSVSVFADASTANLIAWYTFDQAEASKIKDQSGKGNDATLVGSTAITDGKNGKAIQLTGGYVQLPNNILNGVTDITVSTWVYMDSSQNYARLFDFGSGTTRYMFVTSTGRNEGAEGLTAAITTNGWGSEQHVTKGTDLSTGAWKHVTLVIEGKTGILYEDGVKVAENHDLTLNPSSLGSTTSNFIGKSQFAGDAAFRGKFEDFRIYNKALSAAEITSLLDLSDEFIVQSDRDAINLGNLFTVEADIALPTIGQMGSTITWASSKEDVISTDGKVQRPEPGKGNENVLLTATIAKGSASATREFQATVLAELSDQEMVALDKEHLQLGDLDAVTSDLDLPDTGQTGSIITWQSSNSSIIGTDGKVTRPGPRMGDASVTLTATLAKGSASDTKTFEARVIEQPFQLSIKSFRKELAETAIGIAPVLPGIVIAEYNDDETSRQMEVTWADVDPLSYEKPGTFQVEGTVRGSSLKAQAEVKVTEILFQTSFSLDRLQPGEDLVASVKAINKSGSAIPVLVSVARFNQEGGLKDVVHVNKQVGGGQSETLTASLALPSEVAGHIVKVFVWEGDEIKSSNQKPLSAVSQLADVSGAPLTPSGLTAKAEEGKSQITVTWESTPAATAYDLEVDGVIMTNVSSPYEHKGLIYNSEHTYAVRAKSVDHTSAWSLAQHATVQGVPGQASWSVQPFQLSQVSLEASPFTENRDRTYSYLLFVDNDRMLYAFRDAAGLSTEGAQPLGGWDAPNSNLRGHSTGHYLSALSMAYASSGDDRFKEKLDEMIVELGKVQDAMPAKGYSAGFLSGYSEDQFIKLEQYTTYPTIWAPYYTLHKIMAGLVDAYKYAGNEQALEIVEAMGEWTHGRLSVLPKEQLKRMWSIYIAGEYGGMNEVLAEMFAITGNDTFLETAKLFDNETLFKPTAENTDTLTGKHANQHIPQITGALRIFDQTNDPYYYKVADHFWEMVVDKRTFNIGGTGQGEMFRGADSIAAILDDKTAETCATYNMLKLTRNLFFHNPDPAYMDYYEKALYNHILASQQHSEHGHTTYFVPLGPGNQKSYTNDYNSFTCCMGTGLENHVKYQESIYFHSADLSTLYVNLFIPSTLNWQAKGFTIKQTTSYPEEGATSITVDGNGPLAIKLRVPSWAENGYNVSINGVQQNVDAVPGTYVTLDRTWTSGDKIDIAMPFSLRLEKTPDDPKTGSIYYGPLVMVGKSNSTTWLNLLVNENQLSQSIVSTGPLSFTTNGVTLVPMYEAHNFRYHAYFKINS